VTSLRHFLVLVAAVACCALAWQAHAAVPWAGYACLPKTAITSLATGSPRITKKNTAGTVDAWWCKEAVSSSTTPGKDSYKLERHVVLNKYRTKLDPLDLLDRVWAASAPVATANAEVLAAQVIPVPGSLEEFDYATLRRLGCLAAATPPYLVPIDPLPADYCGAEPVPPGAQPEVWRTPAAGTFALYTVVAGKLAAKVAGRIATANALGDCTRTKVMSGSSVYCPLATGAVDEATLMRKVPP
jgi:hypothetical protein